MNKKTALIAGATGLVGKELLAELLFGGDYEKVYVLVRRPLELHHPKLSEIICDFDKLEEVHEVFDVDDVFCCLGTTIKKAKSKEAMYKVDVEYPITMANLSKQKGVKHFLIISSVNANASSKLWYPRMKGLLEEQLKNFELHTLSIFQPSLLLGNRNEFRFAENMAAKLYGGLSSLMKDSWKSRFAIEAKTVAKAMYEVAQQDIKGIKVYSANEMDYIVRENRTDAIEN
ncbi:oxidoreductase [Anaerobacillus sp. MEB173]|uniref:oxidoreductase n=1 Tax=Anaerobacillus sp. MEB173 TaxID=3383345 RepID=UPI003F90BC4C